MSATDAIRARRSIKRFAERPVSRDEIETMLSAATLAPNHRLTQPWRFRKKFNAKKPFAIYIGRIDENKGCKELFSHFERYAVMYPHGLDLVLVGSAVLPVPKHPRIHHLGFLEDQDKYDAMAASELLIMPSYLESLSMVALEAWAMGKPVLANAKCDVLQGQCIRSNAGLFYANYAEFAEAMRAIDTTPSLQAALGSNGRAFFERHYSWPVLEKKYVDMLQQLSQESAPRTMEPAPGWFTRRRRTQHLFRKKKEPFDGRSLPN